MWTDCMRAIKNVLWVEAGRAEVGHFSSFLAQQSIPCVYHAGRAVGQGALGGPHGQGNKYNLLG